MHSRRELMETAAAALLKECEYQGYNPGCWDDLGDGESMMWLCVDDAPPINIGVIVDAIAEKLNIKLGD